MISLSIQYKLLTHALMVSKLIRNTTKVYW